MLKMNHRKLSQNCNQIGFEKKRHAAIRGYYCTGYWWKISETLKCLLLSSFLYCTAHWCVVFDWELYTQQNAVQNFSTVRAKMLAFNTFDIHPMKNHTMSSDCTAFFCVYLMYKVLVAHNRAASLLYSQ